MSTSIPNSGGLVPDYTAGTNGEELDFSAHIRTASVQVTDGDDYSYSTAPIYYRSTSIA